MNKNRRLAPVLPTILAAIFLLSPFTVAADWLQWGGPTGDFKVEAKGLAEWWPADGPTTLWKRSLGGGYSSILYKDGRLFTMYRDGDDEIVVALNAETGATIWEDRYKPTIWPDMRHSFGLGPNGTPLIVDDRIVSIGVDGQMRCLDLAGGRLLWNHDLPAKYGRRKRDEEYGYSGSPLNYQGKIIALVGGTDHAVVAFDPADGAPVWESAPGGISYAAPTITTLGGQEQFIYFSPQGVVSLDPVTGRRLWGSEMEYNNGNHLTPIVRCDDEHIWVGSQFPTGGGRLLEITRDEDRWNARRVWFETYLRASHWTSIRLGDYIYGSIGGNSTSLLAAFNWHTGKIAWRQRGFHKAQSLYADGKLLFVDEDGQLAIGRVSPAGFELLDSAQVTESVSWSLPTLVGTRLYLRDQSEILALDLAEGDGERPERKPVDAGLDETALLGEFGNFVRKVGGAANKTALIDEFMAKQESFPIVEDDSLVHFVFRGEIPDVAISGNFLGLREVEPLYRVPETELYFRSYRLKPAAHFEYQFNIFDDPLGDPLNPRRIVPSDEVTSVVTTAGWTEPAHLRPATAAGGQLDTFNWESAILGNDREIKIYLPAGYATSKERYPLVLVNYGDQALEQGRWVNSLDNLIGNSIAPLVAVFIPRVDFNEYGPRMTEFSDAIEKELVPYVDEHYRLAPGPGKRAMTGIASGGFAAAFIVLAKPELIGNAALQSFYFRGEAEEELRSMIAKGDTDATRFYVEWSENDLYIEGDLECENDSRELAGLLKAQGYDTVTNEVSDGAGWGSWRARTDRILESFFPPGD